MRVVLLAMILVPWAIADAAANCYLIRNQDAQNECLAEREGNSLYCHQIRNDDQRNYCLAKVDGNSLHCYQIADEDLRNHCLALTD